MFKTRCKFVLTEITETAYSPTARRLKFEARYDQTIPEDRRYTKATPSGSFEMTCDNPVALADFKINQAYYFDITPVE